MKKIILILESILILFLIFSCSTPGSGSSSGEKDSSKKNIREIVKNIEIAPDSIDTNGIINIKVFLKDDSPEINYICVYLYSPRELTNNEGVVLWESLSYDDVEGCFIGTININNYHESGIWKIGEVWIEDKDGNDYKYEIESSYSNDFYTLSRNLNDQYKLTNLQIKELGVTNTTPDLDFPELNSYLLEPGIINGNGIVTITIKTKDNIGGTGISDVYAGIKIKYKDGSQSILTSGSYDIAIDSYICNITLRNSDQKGTWYIDEIELRDYAGNKISYKYDSFKNSSNLIKYLSDNNDNYQVTDFIIERVIKK